MDRKALIREYKETARPMGVFRVRNAANGKSFIGSTNDLPSMLNRQRFQLESGGHPNRELQREWDEYGPDAFEFDVLDAIEADAEQPDYDPTDDLRTLEALWVERLQPFGDQGYNKPPKQDV